MASQHGSLVHQWGGQVDYVHTAARPQRCRGRGRRTRIDVAEASPGGSGNLWSRKNKHTLAGTSSLARGAASVHAPWEREEWTLTPRLAAALWRSI